MRIPLIACALPLVLAALPAASQMRAGQPEVLAPAPRHVPHEPPPWDALRARLGKRDRVMLLWEDELDAAVATRYREVETLDRRVHGQAAGVMASERGYYGDAAVAVAGADAHVHERRERFADDDAPMATPLATGERELQAQFMTQMRQGGLRFIDRTLATRLTGVAAGDGRPNVHAIETRALSAHADYVMEVTSHADGESGSGRRYRVALRDTGSGETLLDFDSAARPSDGGPRSWVATANGFERAEAPAIAPADVARTLALETGRRLADALVRR